MGLFKQPEHRRFNLKTRYWDPEAEARKEREKRIRAELGLAEDGDEYIPDVKASLQKEYAKRASRRRSWLLNPYLHDSYHYTDRDLLFGNVQDRPHHEIILRIPVWQT